MAIAGSVAPVFRDGGYDETAIYDFYHALIHNNKLYFCRKDGTIGHEPQEESDEYWFLSIDGNIVDASTLNGKTESELSVANSEQLGGKGASEYVQRLGIVSDVSFLNNHGYTYNYECVVSPDAATQIGLPSKGLPYQIKYYSIDENGFSTQMAIEVNGIGVYLRPADGVGFGAWSDRLATTADLANYLPKTGGTVEKNAVVPFEVKNTGADVVAIGFNGNSGSLGGIGLNGANNPTYFGTNGNFSFHHDGNSAKVVQATSAPSDTTAVWVDTANKLIKAYINSAWTAI